MKRTSHTAFAREYARIRADLLATEGAAVAAYRTRRALSRPVERTSSKQQRHRAESQQFHLTGESHV